ncbi:amino acid adenylation domain-containing protein [Streptomyces sp. NPDC006289]|uniref:amino acid adenylation domain-containing protein n=1 Tax=Streptomyces sp. NPDC006289 TaxID=3156744 RepID=UPI0033A5D13D
MHDHTLPPAGAPADSHPPAVHPLPPPSALAEAVLAQARRTPGAPAVEDGTVVIDYAGLDRLSGRVASALRAAGVRPGQAVAVCLPRSWQLVCVMLGIRRAGATVVPLDRLSPDRRRRHILDDSAAVAVVHAAADGVDLPASLPALDVDRLTGGDDAPAGVRTPDGPSRGTASEAAFVFYTSGTTGLPKGVEVTDAGVLRLAGAKYVMEGEGGRYGCLSNPAFDALSFEVWTPLLTGGVCVVLHDEVVQSPTLFAAALRDLRIDTLFITVSLFNAVVAAVPDCFAAAGRVLIGGEQLNAHVVRRWYETNTDSSTVLFNAYGPTEATTFALCHPIARESTADTVPIGTALPGTGILLRTPDRRIAEPGETAELLLAGEALALGYRNLPEETERRFLLLPRAEGGEERWYRTGDLVRADDEGRVTYLGRADRQVKVRGFRIEPGEVERHLLAHPAVRQAHVCTRREDADQHELIAFLVLEGDLSYGAYEQYLADTLPAYMRPHRTHPVERIPLNANGKADEAALLDTAQAQPPWRGDHRGDQAATVAQREILDLAAEVLGVAELHPADRWIPSGGDSLKALRLRFDIQRRFGVDVPQDLVLRADFAALAAAVHAPDAAGDIRPPVPVAAPGATAPASSEQERLWVLHERDPEDAAYDVPLAFGVRGNVRLPALRRAVRTLVERHTSLRTRLLPTARGLLQEVEAPYDPWQPCEAGADEPWQAPAARFFAHRFDLRSPHMCRATWLPSVPDGPDRGAADGGTLLLHLHHIAVDGCSLGILLRDLTEAYDTAYDGDEGAEHPPAHGTATTVAQFAHWQRTWRATPAYDEQRTRLRAHYEQGAEAAPAATAPPAPVRPSARLLRTTLDTARRGALDRLAAEHGQTRFQLLLSAYVWSLYGVTGQTRPLVAAPVANRPRPEFADTVGMLANTVLLPMDMEPEATLHVLLSRHGAMSEEVLRGQEVLLADVVADRPADARGDLFDYLFVQENTDFSALRLPGCTVGPLWPRPLGAKCRITLSIVEHASGLDCLWEYREDVDEEEVRAAARLLAQAVDRMADGADVRLRDLVAPYRRTLPEHGRGPEPAPEFTTVAEGFELQVRRTPDAPAVATDRTTLSYAELDAHAAVLAERLRPYLPEDPAAPAAVALYLEPSVEHVVSLLAAARLNLTAVPLDPSYPPSLLRQVIAQAAPVCVLVAPERADALDTIAPASLPRHPLVCPADPPAAEPAPGHRALRPLYTLFTSGSTGTPKGVQVPDRTLCNLLSWQRDHGGLAAPAVTQQFSMLSFDVSFQEILTTLCSGGLLRLVDPSWRQDMPTLLDQLESTGVERLFLPYVALQLLAEHGARTGRHPSRLRDVITAGEQLVCTDAIRSWFAGLPGARLFNHYGPTETHVVSGLCLEGDPALWPLRPAIGRPVSGALLRVVDKDGHAVPPGATGHLWLGGPMAGRCYLGDTGLNRTRFVDDPEAGTFYRSGDLGRFDREGLLHYAGRIDAQVKISGHRLELGAVEAALLQYPGVTNAVVTETDGSLVACLQADQDPDITELDRHLGALLPPHARISRFRRLTRLPRTPSGKVDRQGALSAAGHELRPRDDAGPARSALERRLTDLFLAVTGRRPGVRQRFFEAGATSLDLMRFQLRCAGEGDLHFGVPELFEYVTIHSLARLLEERGTQAADADVPPGTPAPAVPPAAPGADSRTAARAAPDSGRTRPAPADEPVAVIGMAVRLPGAVDLAAFWDLVTSGGRGIEDFPAADGLVGARSQMDGLLAFDPGHFGISPHEARLMDPQQRHLLMACAQALTHAGIADAGDGRVGLLAACGESTYFQNLLREADPAALPDSFRLALHHEKDFLSTRAAYHLGLRGPALTVQSACSSSLVGVHLAAGLLRQDDADVMLVGGVLVDRDLTDGYTHRPNHIYSPDGHCRPFSADAAGTVGASGVGVVVLKPLAAARRDGDTVYAVITGSAVNNDGADKMSYSAPSLAGQRAAVSTALRRSGRAAAEVGYVEAHGTGTRLGDPVEAAALRAGYGLADDAGLALSSVKSQIGHTGAAAGVVGLVRAVLAVHHGTIPPTADFDRLNPAIDAGPFRIPVTAQPWPRATPRVAGVSSFGIGGTNAHLLVESPAGTDTPPQPRDEPVRTPLPCLVLSANSPAALRADAHRIAAYLGAHPSEFTQVLRHLQTGRPVRTYRAAAACEDAETAVAWLRAVVPQAVPVPPTGIPAVGSDAQELATAWAAGHTVDWTPGPGPAPWDFPPPAFDLADYDFPRESPTPRTPAYTSPTPRPATPAPVSGRTPDPQRLPADRWMHQPQWTRLRRARTDGSAVARTAVVVAGERTDPAAWRELELRYARVVRLVPGKDLIRIDDDRYEADPADTGHLAAVLAEASAPGPAGTAVDWLHALPLAIDGDVGERSLDTARRACLDTVAALSRAVAEVVRTHGRERDRPRVWLLSCGAQPVTGPVRRPEAGLLAAATRVPNQELGTEMRWLDLPGPDPTAWSAFLPDLLLDAPPETSAVALRDSFWWHRAIHPVTAPDAVLGTESDRSREAWGWGTGTYLVLGGTGGIGAVIAARILRRPESRVVLLSRRALLPPALAPWRDRITLVRADLAGEDTADIAARLAPHLDSGLAGIVHAAGTAAGGLIALRDAEAARGGTDAKLRGALLMERLIDSHEPGHAVYCSSMASLFGGVGQFDYAAANGCLDAFAQYRTADGTSRTVRSGIGWDIWREAGMARSALGHDEQHRRHLLTGLTSDEGAAVFEQAMRLQLPHLWVNTTDLSQARSFYERPPTAAVETTRGPAEGAQPTPHLPPGHDLLAQLGETVAWLLGVDDVGTDVSLYDLGADSLMLLELVDQIKQRFGADLDLSRFSHRVSVAEIAALIDATVADDARSAASDPSVQVEVWQRGVDGSDVLCLVHPVGGDIQAYRPLVSALGDRLTVCLIADPALRAAPDRPGELLADRAARYLDAIRAELAGSDGRLFLAGWSFGAWVALSMAAHAEEHDRPVAGLYLLDPPPPGAGAAVATYDDQQVDAVFARELGGNRAGGLSESGREYAERLARCCRANLAAMAGHRLPRLSRTPSSLWIAERTVPDVPSLAPEPVPNEEWDAHLPPPVRAHRIDADHYTLVAPPHVESVAAVILRDAAVPDEAGDGDRTDAGAALRTPR